jgi:hypothetical protein
MAACPNIPQQRGLLAAEEAAQLGQHLDQAVDVVVARLEMGGALCAATPHAVAQRGRHGGRFQLNGWVSTAGRLTGAQVRRTFGVRLSEVSSKKTRQALRLWASA